MVSLRKGWQLAAAVLLAWALSNVLGLQGGWWAGMSALIIVRPGADSTLDAGWARARGAVLGSAVALLGAGLQAQGLHTVAVTLLVVGALAFWSAAAPGWRSAPITALIVLQASAMPGHSAWQVALLRIAEIGVGVVAGVLVTLPVARQGAAACFDAPVEHPSPTGDQRLSSGGGLARLEHPERPRCGACGGDGAAGDRSSDLLVGHQHETQRRPVPAA